MLEIAALLDDAPREHLGAEAIVEAGPQACQLQESSALRARPFQQDLRALLAASWIAAPSPELAGHLPQELAGKRDDVASLEAAGPKLPIDGPGQDGERTRVTSTGSFTEG